MLYLEILHLNRNRFASLVRAVHVFKALDQINKIHFHTVHVSCVCRALTHPIFAVIFSAMVLEKLRGQKKLLLLTINTETHSCLDPVFSSFSLGGRLDYRYPEIISMTHTALSL